MNIGNHKTRTSANANNYDSQLIVHETGLQGLPRDPIIWQVKKDIRYSIFHDEDDYVYGTKEKCV